MLRRLLNSALTAVVKAVQAIGCATARRLDDRRHRRDAARVLARQVAAEHRVVRVAEAIVADHYAIYRDMYDTPHIPHREPHPTA